MIEEKLDRSAVKKSFGAYSFQIQGYSGLPSRVSDCVESPEFSLCGHKWQLRIFPGGSLDSHREYLSFYLASKSNRVARASYKLIVLNQVEGLEDEGFSSSTVRIFEAKSTQVICLLLLAALDISHVLFALEHFSVERVQIDGWGRDKFMEASLLRDPDFGFCIDDSVTFKVEITVYGDLEAVGSCEQTGGVGAEDSTLERSMFELLHFPTHSDVSFIVGAERVVVPAHKCILMARSPVFYAMFSHEMQEELGGEVCVPDIPVPVMREVLHYAYTGQREDAEIPPLELFHAAVKYQIPGLIAESERYFLTRMDVDTVVGLLEMADGVGAQHLKVSCMQYIAQNASVIVQKQSFHELDEPLLRDVNRLITLVNKRKGCGSGAVPVERERRFGNVCTIM
jgi:hypothetical protein